ncbi:LOW QUALITY PROTEIN: probable inactive leucine-rich repeat receptor kinase XIAO [Arabidopsis lyrata subsp. lyrata]|uniref:LOW QUALITY PROTEIN: probable inactive leucine-rich repeat receptor kinase XIAO n=1 Tax=Arabidopsis lyrata subsp. lyrata TaxID=81972 RepID=UPI000A29C9AB|nr:LOW QUALITY PROTEIN: probable inactive leucine-rich repeat receptor kinase XIAO [Arabidopsis lyrata subsp. lyrata]|eukprot:XP_020890783.1 LOW QUALITY PROTEIN: probable inactive leucine-rich repeat receptor kinase XIAO [Arabidopsis lyrata subsp. lyrata]
MLMMFSPAYVMVMNLMVMDMMMVSLLDAHGHRSCIESERKGLLELKAYLNISEYPYDWPNDTNSDCCKWERVKCDLTSGRVIGLFLIDTYYPPPLLNLSFFYPFGELQTLNLSNFWCQGWFDHIHGYKSFERLKNLKILDLSENGIKILSNTVLRFLNSASSLKTLILHGNNMEGTFPMKELKNLRNLELLDLSKNEFVGPVPDLVNFHNLQGLDLSDNKFSGSLDNKGLCLLKNLRELDLSQNKFTGQFPQCFDSLTQLQVLDISSNNFNGTVPSLIRNLDSIEYLALSDNEFEGFFSFELIANLLKLKVFKLSSRSNLLHLKKLTSLQPKFQLSVIELQNCNLENVPSFIQHQKDLRAINLSNNKLTVAFPFWLLEKYPNLRVLLLQNNSLTILELPRLLNHSLQILDLSANSFDQRLPENIGKVLPYLKHLNLSNNGFQWILPSSFGEMKDIKFLDLSHNNFSGSLPMEFLIGCCYSLHTLKLSYNKFFGQIFPKPTNFGSLVVLIANNNLFTGIADGLLNSKSLGVLDLSNNYLQGVIPSWFGGFFFAYLFLSNNLLEGTLPSTLFNIPTFKILDLSGNKFSGNLPSQFNGMNMSLLYLNDNEFSGTIPSTLIKDVLVLDLRNNKLSGTIPHFVKNEFILSLLLRGNTLTGYIPTDLCGLRSIRILDLANNKLKGTIPSCLDNVSFGRRLDYEVNGDKLPFEINDDEELAVYSRLLVLPREYHSSDYTGILMFNVEFASKSRYDSYTQESFTFMFGLDLSSNELGGDIPKELGDLQKIRALNLSHNSLSGLIPGSFSNLTDIESIDLSINALRGPIPQDLSKLDYMVVFNVSYNNLSGSIPSQGKFSTLDETNYIGNTLLCGSDINRSCDDNSTTGFFGSDAQSEDEETTIDMDIFYWSLAATYGVKWITFIVFLCFDSPWRQEWLRLVEAFINFFFF